MAKAKAQFLAYKEGGPLRLRHKDVYDAYVRGLKDGDYVLIINRPMKLKILPQLSYYYGVIVPTVINQMVEDGNTSFVISVNGDRFEVPLTAENVDTFLLKPKCARVREGKHIDKTDMTIDEASVFIENCIQWAAEYLGCVIPEPV